MRQAAGMHRSRAPLPGPDAARPSRLHSPGPDLILCPQLFPGSLGSPHASRSEKMCFTLWPCRKHARSLIWLTCNSLSSAESFETHWFHSVLLVIYPPWAEHSCSANVLWKLVLLRSGSRLGHLITWQFLHLLVSVSCFSYLNIVLSDSLLVIGSVIIHHSYFRTDLLFLCKSVSLVPFCRSLLFKCGCSYTLIWVIALMKNTKLYCDTASCTAARPSGLPPRSLLLFLPPTHTELTGSCISSSVRERSHSWRKCSLFSYNTKLFKRRSALRCK